MSGEVGRPLTDWNKIKPILRSSYHNGLNITQACLEAGISKETYYQKIKADQVFSDEMQKAQQRVFSKARQNIAQAIEAGDKDISKWMLERRDKEFKPKQDLTTDDKPFPTPIMGGSSVSTDDSIPEDSQTQE